MATDGPPPPRPPVDVHLRLTRGSDPVQGRLLAVDGDDVDFEGYMELVAAIHRIVDVPLNDHDNDNDNEAHE